MMEAEQMRKEAGSSGKLSRIMGQREMELVSRLVDLLGCGSCITLAVRACAMAQT